MKKGRTSTKSKGNLVTHVAKSEKAMEWGLNDEAEQVAAEAEEEELEHDAGTAERRHPQL
jgi:hypothetical protein